MKLFALLLFVTACSDNICTMDVASATVTVDRKLAITGVFDEVNPSLDISGPQTTTVSCALISQNAAECDTSALPAGTYTVAYDFTCKDSGNKKDALAVGDSVPLTFTLPAQ